MIQISETINIQTNQRFKSEQNAISTKKYNQKQEDSKGIFRKMLQNNFPFFLFGFGQVVLVLAFIYPNQNRMHFIESSIARGSAAFFISFFIMRKNNQFMSNILLNDPKACKYLMIRNVLIIIYSNVYALSQLYLSQPVAQTINCTGPLFTFLMDYLNNGVKINKSQCYGICFVVFGGFLISNQKFISHFVSDLFLSNEMKSFSNESMLDQTFEIFVILLLFLAVGMWGVAQTFVKNLAKIDCSVINMHFACIYMITNGISYPVLVQKPLQPQKILYAVFLCGVPNTIAAMCMLKATQLTKQTGILSLMSFVSVVVGYGLSIFRYNQNLDVLAFLGVISIIGGLGTVLVQRNYNLNSE